MVLRRMAVALLRGVGCVSRTLRGQFPPRLMDWRGWKLPDSHLKSSRLLPGATSTNCSESAWYFLGKTSVDSYFLSPTVTLSPEVMRTRFLPTRAPVRLAPKLI